MSAAPAVPLRLPRSAPAWLPFFWNRVLFAGAPDHRTAVRPAALTLVLLLPALLLYPSRGFHLFEPDEGRYAQVGREMFAGGDWVVPTLQGEPYLDKPPLMYWLIAASYSVGGVSEVVARTVPALCVQFTILLVYLLGRRSVGERGAFWAAMLLSVSPLFVSVARLLLLDGLLTLCVTASLLCGFEAVRTGTLLRGWWLLAALASGLGFLTKGPISEVLLFPPLLAFAYLSGTAAPVRFRHALLFGAVVLAVNLPWYVAMGMQRPEFLRYFFWEHNVLRFLQPFDHLQPVWYYVPILLAGFLPGVVVAASYARQLLRSTPADELPPSAAAGFWLLAGGWCLFFFSCSGSKLPTYILPALPPLCLGLGEYVARSKWGATRKPRALVAGFAAVTCGLHFGFVPWYAEERSPLGRPERLLPYLADPAVPVLTYPRHVDSVAFAAGRSDLQAVRTTELNQALVDCHFRPRTVVLFTHGHSYKGLMEALPPSLRLVEHTDLGRPGGNVAEKLAGRTPWGLCDIAVIEPVGGVQRR